MVEELFIWGEVVSMKYVEFPWWLSGKEATCQCRRCRFKPWVWKIPWRRKWKPTAVFLPEKFPGQRSLVSGLQSMGLQRAGHNLVTEHTCTWTMNVVYRTGKISTTREELGKKGLGPEMKSIFARKVAILKKFLVE